MDACWSTIRRAWVAGVRDVYRVSPCPCQGARGLPPIVVRLPQRLKLRNERSSAFEVTPADGHKDLHDDCSHYTFRCRGNPKLEPTEGLIIVKILNFTYVFVGYVVGLEQRSIKMQALYNPLGGG
ncbi:hypothetical protein J6590_060682 [Homalodisca vitripennis]|nr:hypothetical protein J6590_060682 [Homalodisca vitripennis]